MGHESLIMQQSDIGEIADSIKDCLRCGKCKPACATHVPRANLLYSPRNKILATSLLIEAFLYEEQTRRGVSIRHWEEFEDVADHCTVCHKCLSPCPVDIDFGDVSMNMRNLLRKMGQQAASGRQARRRCCSSTRPARRRSRSCARRWSTSASRRSARPTTCCAAWPTRRPRRRRRRSARAPLKEQVIHFVNKKMPGGLPKRTARALLDIEDKDYVPIIRNPKATNADTEAVFYFPGCGSERLFSQVGLATQAMLWHAGVQTVLPPGLPVLRLPAARLGRVRQGREDHHRQPGAVPPRRQHAELPRHQDRGRQLRHLLRPAAGLRVRQDLPRLPHHRHPRVPAREGHHARRPGGVDARRRATCSTTPATAR